MLIKKYLFFRKFLAGLIITVEFFHLRENFFEFSEQIISRGN